MQRIDNGAQNMSLEDRKVTEGSKESTTELRIMIEDKNVTEGCKESTTELRI